MSSSQKRERAQYMHKSTVIDLGADSKLLISLYGRIAQLVRALASHARGRRFESYCDHQLKSTTCMSGESSKLTFSPDFPVTVQLTVRVSIGLIFGSRPDRDNFSCCGVIL